MWVLWFSSKALQQVTWYLQYHHQLSWEIIESFEHQPTNLSQLSRRWSGTTWCTSRPYAAKWACGNPWAISFQVFLDQGFSKLLYFSLLTLKWSWDSFQGHSGQSRHNGQQAQPGDLSEASFYCRWHLVVLARKGARNFTLSYNSWETIKHVLQC